MPVVFFLPRSPVESRCHVEIPALLKLPTGCGYVFWVPTSSDEFNALNSANLDRANLRVQKIDPEHFAVNNEWIDPVDW